MHSRPATLLASALLSLVGIAALPAASPRVVLDDSFDNDVVTGTATNPGCWNIQTIPEGDNGVFERNGYLTLFAIGQPYTYACLNTRLDDNYNFFRRIVTITAEEIVLDHRGLPDQDALFRISLNPMEKRQTMSPNSLSLRFSPGQALLGYRLGFVGKTDAENTHGTERGAVANVRYDGRLTGFTLTLDPVASPGEIYYTLLINTDGSRPVLSSSGKFPLTEGTWGENGKSALIIETRRNIATIEADSYVSSSIGRILITATP